MIVHVHVLPIVFSNVIFSWAFYLLCNRGLQYNIHNPLNGNRQKHELRLGGVQSSNVNSSRTFDLREPLMGEILGGSLHLIYDHGKNTLQRNMNLIFKFSWNATAGNEQCLAVLPW